MGIGWSSSTARSEQNSMQQIGQQYSGTCNVTCDNSIKNLHIDIQDTTVAGGINLTQECTVDATCALTSTTNATASVTFSASNSTSASDAGDWLSGLSNTDISVAESYQDMRQMISQDVQQSCNMTSVNDMDGVTILVADSGITGGINIYQQGNEGGSCTLDNMMTATAIATATANNSAQSGKKAKSSLNMIESIVGFLGLIVVVVVIIVVIKDVMTKKTSAVTGCPTGKVCPTGKTCPPTTCVIAQQTTPVTPTTSTLVTPTPTTPVTTPGTRLVYAQPTTSTPVTPTSSTSSTSSTPGTRLVYAQPTRSTSVSSTPRLVYSPTTPVSA